MNDFSTISAIKKMTLSHVFCQTLTDEDFTVTHNFPMVALGRQFKGKMNRRAACSQMDTFDFRTSSLLISVKIESTPHIGGARLDCKLQA